MLWCVYQKIIVLVIGFIWCTIGQLQLNHLERYYNHNHRDHFYSMEDEGARGYEFERIECYISTSQSTPRLHPWYRLFNSHVTDHYYTWFMDDPIQGYTYEGVTGYLWHTSRDCMDDIPRQWTCHQLYIWYSDTRKDHFYTISQDDYGHDSYVYEYETEYFCASPPPLRRFYNHNSVDHFYTQSERTPPNYDFENVECYMSGDDKENAAPLHQYYRDDANNQYAADHYYQWDNGAIKGYTYQGIVGYLWPSLSDCTHDPDNQLTAALVIGGADSAECRRLYRYYRHNIIYDDEDYPYYASDHFYSISSQTPKGYSRENDMYYCLTLPSPTIADTNKATHIEVYIIVGGILGLLFMAVIGTVLLIRKKGREERSKQIALVTNSFAQDCGK